MNVSETRYARFIELLERYDTLVEFSEAIDKSPGYVGHLKSRTRNIGHKMARHIEQCLGLPDGYMDAANNEIATIEPAPELAIFRRLDRSQKEAILVIMRSMIESKS